MALATTLAATGYSVLVGTVARTHDQAAVFGMVSVIILAAIGGIWVPVFMMTNMMQAASIISCSLKEIASDVETTLCPIADGGDGTLECLVHATGVLIEEAFALELGR